MLPVQKPDVVEDPFQIRIALESGRMNSGTEALYFFLGAEIIAEKTGATSYTYDSDGNVLRKTDARGIYIDHFYDTLHRLTEKNYSDTAQSKDVQYFYDQTTYNGLIIAYGIGRRTGMTDKVGGVTAWSYGVDGATLTERRTISGVTKSISYAYNLDGSVATLTYPTGRIIEYHPTSAGRPDWAKDVANSINYALNAGYHPHGALSTVIYGQAAGYAGITSTAAFDNRLQPTTIVATTPGGTVMNFAYCFNGTVSDFAQPCSTAPVVNNGNVARITNNLNTNRSQRFTYDELNRLKQSVTQATSGAQCFGIEHGYDIWANLLTITQLGTHPACTTSLSQSVATNNRITTLAYDLAGNQLSDGTYAMAWDAESRMKSYSTINYTYDGDGRRTKKSSGKLYWYSIAGDVLAESDLAGTISDEFIFFGGKRIARRASSGSVFYYLGDHLGTSRVIVQGGQSTACYEADNEPFGKERIVTDTCPQAYKFTGKERDTESNLDFLGARYHSSAIARFQSADQPFLDQDAKMPQSWNLYSYTRNKPTRFTDIQGMFSPESHAEFTRSSAHRFGFSRGAAQAMVKANLQVDSCCFWDNPQHGLRDFHVTRKEGIRRIMGVINDRRDQAVQAAVAGNYAAALDSLGRGQHTVQDFEAHLGDTLVGHGRETPHDNDPNMRKAALQASDRFLEDFRNALVRAVGRLQAQLIINRLNAEAQDQANRERLRRLEEEGPEHGPGTVIPGPQSLGKIPGSPKLP